MTPKDLIIGAGIIVTAIAIALSIVVFSAKQEAEAYNRITGKNVSTWDAIFVELRVDAPPK